MIAPEGQAGGFDWESAGKWDAGFALNAVVPFLLVFGVVNAGQLGFVAALVIIWFVGFQLTGRRFDIGRSLVWGAPWLAATQLLPVLQVTTWVAAALVTRLIPKTVIDDRTPVGQQLLVFLLTLLAAQPLLGVATLIGYWRRWARNDLRSQAETDPDAG